jgi:hypothetical protein
MKMMAITAITTMLFTGHEVLFTLPYYYDLQLIELCGLTSRVTLVNNAAFI